MSSMFTPATAVQKHLKVLLFGPAGSGKTTAALTFPNVAVIDTERGTDLYAGRDGIAPFSVMRANTFTAITQAVRELLKNQQGFETLVIDSITPVYDTLVAALEYGANSKTMTYREWGTVKRRMNELYNLLMQLPMHVVITARESVEYDATGKELKKVGVKPDSDKSLAYMLDFVIRMDIGKTGTVIKSRGRDIAAEGEKVKRVNWGLFAPALEFSTGGEVINTPSMDEVIEWESRALNEQDVPKKPAPQTPPPAPVDQPQDGDQRTFNIVRVKRVPVADGKPVWGMWGVDMAAIGSEAREVSISGLETRDMLGAQKGASDGWNTDKNAVTVLDEIIAVKATFEGGRWWFDEAVGG